VMMRLVSKVVLGMDGERGQRSEAGGEAERSRTGKHAAGCALGNVSDRCGSR
jgi:hypothetical protein